MHISDNVFMKIHISIMPKLVFALQCNLSAAIAAQPFDLKICFINEKGKAKSTFFSSALHTWVLAQFVISKDLNFNVVIFSIYLFSIYNMLIL